MPAGATRRTVLQKVRGPIPFHGPAACGHRVSGSLSLPSRGPFHLSFTVLCSIGHQAVFSLTGWSPLIPTGFLVSRGTLDPAAPVFPSPTGLSPSVAGLPRSVPLGFRVALRSPNPGVHALRFGLFPFRSPLLWKSLLFSLPPATWMFRFAGFPPCASSGLRRLRHTAAGLSPAGFPHSDTRGSTAVCASPRLFAAYRVFLRLLVPRHPPCALLCLTLFFLFRTLRMRRPAFADPFHGCLPLCVFTDPDSLFSFGFCSVFGFQGTTPPRSVTAGRTLPSLQWA